MDLCLSDLEVGQERLETIPYFSSNGRQLGKISITTTKIEDADDEIIPYSESIQDYWRADGTYSSKLDISGLLLGASFQVNLNYQVLNGVSSLRLTSSKITTLKAPFLFFEVGYPLQSPDVIDKASGTEVKSSRSIPFSTSHEETPLYTWWNLNAGIKILPNDPGYVRLFINVNDR